MPWVGKMPWKGNGSPLQYSCLENPIDKGAWWAIVHGIARVRHNLATQQQVLFIQVLGTECPEIKAVESNLSLGV